MQRLGVLLALVVLLGGGGAAARALGDDGAPGWTTTVTDPVGDSSGPDISSVAATVGADGVLTLTMSVANQSGVAYDDAVQFQLTTPSGGVVEAIAYETESDLKVVADGEWVNVHELSTTLTNGVWSVALPLGELQSVVHQPVTPVLLLTASAWVWRNGFAEITDSVPNTGFVTIETAHGASSTTDTAPTTPAPSPGPSLPTGTPPRLLQREMVVRGGLEWTTLELTGVPSLDDVEIDCTAVCSLVESPLVVRSTAKSARFVGRPFAPGASFVAEVTDGDGAGWWYRATVVRKAGRVVAAESHGCIDSLGALVRC